MFKNATSSLEEELFKTVENNTPDYVKNNKLLDLTNENEFIFRLKKEHLLPYDEKNNPEGLDLEDWLKNYEKEAKVSTAGIRGSQNVLYPNDTRFPINLIGILLATTGKALALKEKYPNKDIKKILGREVRYNSDKMLDLIARIQAGFGINTIVPDGRKTIPIWLASFLAFKLDFVGGEYITSSHGISVKNATKDLNSQGSQYLPEESMEFVNKIKYIFEETRKNGYFDIKISNKNNDLIDESLMTKLNDGTILYEEYLKNGVAGKSNLELIKNINNKIVIENVGGSAYRTLSRILDDFKISDKYVWLNTQEDSFFHSIGKYDKDPKGNKCFYDYSVDATVLSTKESGEKYFPVIETLHYDEKLKSMPTGTVVLITDPDHDRLSVCQIEPKENIPYLEKLGIDFVKLNDRILTVYTANQSFLLIMDFWVKLLKSQNLFNNHPRFIIKTTASAMSWDEWAKANNIKVVNVPVGFKEIANVMKKVEKQIKENPEKDVVVKDVFGNEINLGVNPRVVFAGEESGGMIIGAEELIKSLAGRIAIAMREKSATEAIIVASALTSELEKQNIYFSNMLEKVFEENKIVGKFDTRVDIAYYNESEPDIKKLKQAKVEGEAKRTQNDLFYLSLALLKRQNKITLENIKETLSTVSSELDFSNLNDVKFVGDGTYLEFTDKYIEIRPSGTDAKTKAYGAGDNKDNITHYAKILGNYSGERNSKYNEYVSEVFYNNAKELSLNIYNEFANEGADNTLFEIPDYNKTLNF